MCHVRSALPCGQMCHLDWEREREREIPDFSAPLPIAVDTVSVPTGVSSPSLSTRLPLNAEILPLPDVRCSACKCRRAFKSVQLRE